MRGGGFGPAGFGNGQGQRLQPVIFQHDGSDIVGHGFQQGHTFGLGQFTATFCRCQCDLDVHFIVGTVHACRIVDEIGIGTPARQRKFDAACLRDAKVCTFANNLGADRVGIYPQANTSGTGVRLTMTEANGQQVVTGLALTQVPDQAIYDGATLKNSQGAFFPLDYVIHDPHDGQLYFTASVTTVVCYGHVHFTDEAYP